MNCISNYSSPLGTIILGSDGEKLLGLWFDKPKNIAAGLVASAQEAELPVFRETKRWLDFYFSGRDPCFTPDLQLNGSSFRQEVWQILRAIPYGTTLSYGEIAAQLAQKHGVNRMSAQAVGGAIGHNPIALIVPCHRVIGANGKLKGYAYGLERKQQLLKLEQGVEQGIAQRNK